jgi:hypothetical protein
MLSILVVTFGKFVTWTEKCGTYTVLASQNILFQRPYTYKDFPALHSSEV